MYTCKIISQPNNDPDIELATPGSVVQRFALELVHALSQFADKISLYTCTCMAVRRVFVLCGETHEDTGGSLDGLRHRLKGGPSHLINVYPYLP